MSTREVIGVFVILAFGLWVFWVGVVRSIREIGFDPASQWMAAFLTLGMIVLAANIMSGDSG